MLHNVTAWSVFYQSPGVVVEWDISGSPKMCIRDLVMKKCLSGVTLGSNSSLQLKSRIISESVLLVQCQHRISSVNTALASVSTGINRCLESVQCSYMSDKIPDLEYLYQSPDDFRAWSHLRIWGNEVAERSNGYTKLTPWTATPQLGSGRFLYQDWCSSSGVHSWLWNYEWYCLPITSTGGFLIGILGPCIRSECAGFFTLTVRRRCYNALGAACWLFWRRATMTVPLKAWVIRLQ